MVLGHAPLAKLDIASVYGTEGQEFESLTVHQKDGRVSLCRPFMRSSPSGCVKPKGNILTSGRRYDILPCMQTIYDTIVIGGGIAGYSAALTLKSLKHSCLWLGAELFGEKLLSAEYVRNYPAFTGDGAAFGARLQEQMAREGILFTRARADGVYAGDLFTVTAGGEVFQSRTVILATGVETAAAVKGERGFVGRGVSYCAVCDGALYKGKMIAAVLSAPKFAEEAEYLAGFAKTVHAFCLYPAPRFAAGNIIVHEERPLEVLGGMRVEKLRVQGGELPVDGVFFLKNSAPPAALVGGLETVGEAVKTAKDGSTNLAGLFAAGDVTGRPYQYVKAAGEGLTAAYSAHAFLSARRGGAL